MTMTPEEQQDILGVFVDALEQMAVPYFLTGSLAMMYHGSVRVTHDADIAFDGVYGTTLARRLRKGY